jgi:hypothetical protein
MNPEPETDQFTYGKEPADFRVEILKQGAKLPAIVMCEGLFGKD